MPALGLSLGLPFRPMGGGASFAGALDANTSNLSASWSVARRLLTSYTGPLIRVRRSGDNSESDFSATANGDLDASSLAAFCVAGGGTQHGYVTKIYAQAGSVGDLTQTTASLQPQLINAGSINTENGKPVAVFDGSNDTMAVTWTGGSIFSAYLVSKLNAAGNYPMLLNLNEGTVELRGFDTSGQPEVTSAGSIIKRSSSSVGTFGQYTWQQQHPSGNVAAWLDDVSFGSPLTAQNVSINTVRVSGRSGSFLANMDFSELFLYAAVQGTAARQAIQSIQKTYFGTA